MKRSNGGEQLVAFPFDGFDLGEDADFRALGEERKLGEESWGSSCQSDEREGSFVEGEEDGTTIELGLEKSQRRVTLALRFEVVWKTRNLPTALEREANLCIICRRCGRLPCRLFHSPFCMLLVNPCFAVFICILELLIAIEQCRSMSWVLLIQPVSLGVKDDGCRFLSRQLLPYSYAKTLPFLNFSSVAPVLLRTTLQGWITVV